MLKNISRKRQKTQAKKTDLEGVRTSASDKVTEDDDATTSKKNTK